jgi:hypothetical protein
LDENQKRLVTFYVEQHNTVMPQSAFAGQTPNEIYFSLIPDPFDSDRQTLRLGVRTPTVREGLNRQHR